VWPDLPARTDARFGRSVVLGYEAMSAPVELGLYKSSACVRALFGGVARYGIDPQQLLVGSSLDPGLLADSLARISVAEWQQLVRRAILVTQDPGLGLALGGTAPDHAFQIVSQLLFSSRTLRQSMSAFQRYRCLLGNSSDYTLVEQGDLAYFVCTTLVPFPDLPHFEAEMVLSMIYRGSRRFATLDSEDAQELWMAHPAPAHAARYAEVFRCPVRFDRPQNAIVFSRRYLDQRQPYADPHSREILSESAERLLGERSAPTLPNRVRALLRHEPNLYEVDARRISKALKLAPRTLKRRLIEANAPWSSLLDEARRQAACDELRSNDTSLRALAERLGFSDQSAFIRAFKRWTGKTPAQYRLMIAEPGRPSARIFQAAPRPSVRQV
jgi:AraC-like DNA-binding protein